MSNEGWICPVCNRGKAPHIETCDCAGVIRITEPIPTRPLSPDVIRITPTAPDYDWMRRAWPNAPLPPVWCDSATYTYTPDFPILVMYEGAN